MGLFDRFFSSIARRARNRFADFRPRVEQLEDRTVLTVNFYVDFGDMFPSSGFQTTVDDLMNYQAGSNPRVNGPDLTGLGYGLTDAIRIRGFNASHAGDKAADLAARAEIMSLLRRYYEPLDINVVELTAEYQTINGYQIRGATTIADVSINLGLNESETKNNDTYLFMGLITVANDNPFDFGYLGISNGTDMPNITGTGSNETDGSVLVFMGRATDTFYESNLQLALTAAHEGGHSFGLAHASTSFPQPGFNPYIEIMSYFNDGFSSFSRYPMVAGDGNADPDFLNSALGQNTTYDQMAVDPEIGANPAFNYVTGTGSNDIITITRSGPNQAIVSVRAFSDSAYTSAITVPGLGGTAYTYTIPLDKPVRIDAGPGDDRVVLDGDLDTAFTLYAMQGTDELIVEGKNAPSAVYTPGTNTEDGLDGNPDRRGTVTVGSTVIHFQEFELSSLVTVRNVEGLTFQTPGGNDTLTIASKAGKTSVTGKISDTIDFVPFSFSNVSELIFDVGNNDTADIENIITLRDPQTATGLKTVTVLGGIGTDRFVLNTPNLTLPVADGGYRFLGGDGDDRAEFTGSNLTFTADSKFTFDGGNGSDSLLLPSGNVTLSTGVSLTFNGEGGDDVWTLPTGSLTLEDGSTFLFNGGDQDDTLVIPSSLLSFHPGANFLFNAGVGNDMMDFSTVALDFTGSKLTFQGEEGNDRLRFSGADLNLTGPEISFEGGTGDDVVEFTTATATLNGTNLNFTGGMGNDLLRLPGANLFLKGGALITFDAGENDDTLDVGGKLNFEVGSDINFLAGNGTDTLAATGDLDRTWSITGNNSGNLDSFLPFSGIEQLLGGSRVDTFTYFPGGQFTGVMDGAGGEDVLDLSRFRSVRVNLLNPGATDGFDIAFKAANPGALKNLNRVLVSSVGGDLIFGASAPGIWNVAGDAASYGNPGQTISFVGFDRLYGGPLRDLYLVQGSNPGRALLDGVGGADTVRILGTAGNDNIVLGRTFVRINGWIVRFVRMESLEVAGGLGNDRITATSLAYAVRSILLMGEEGNDIFTVGAAVNAILTVNGGSPSLDGVDGDILILRQSQAQLIGTRPGVAARAGRYNYAGRLWIDFSDIERIFGNKNMFLPF